MKTAICYYSYHHGNTLKVIEAIKQVGDVDLIHVATRQAVHLEAYDCIGFASGIYGFEVHKAVVDVCQKVFAKREKRLFCLHLRRREGKGRENAARDR